MLPGGKDAKLSAMQTESELPVAELILANLGTPAAPTAAAVRAFLAEFLGDPMVVEKPRWLWLPILHGIILRRRPAKVAELYREIWGPEGSPLAAGTVALSAAVAARLPGVRVTHCYRYGAPSLATRLAESAAAHPGSRHPIHVVPLFPQRTSSSSGTLERLVQRCGDEARFRDRLRVAPLAPDDGGYVAALTAGVQQTPIDLADPTAHLVVSFHGIPEAVNVREGARYTRDCQATFDALLAALALPPERATLAFQSRFGRDPWIGPATDTVLTELPARGVRAVVVATPGFLTSSLETLEELGIRGRAEFLAAGGEAFALAPTPIDHNAGAPVPHPRLVDALASLV